MIIIFLVYVIQLKPVVRAQPLFLVVDQIRGFMFLDSKRDDVISVEILLHQINWQKFGEIQKRMTV